MIKIHHRSLTRSRPLTRLGCFKIRQQISFLTLPYQVKDSSLDSSGCPEMMTMDAWQNVMDGIQDDVRWEDKGK